MQISLKIALIVILLIYLFCISKSVKRKNMKIGYLIFWCITGLILIIALLAPNFVENISIFLGFGLPINMIFSCAIFIILYLTFDLTKQITKVEKQNVLLIQELSLLKTEMKQLKNKNELEDKDERI
ncbi:MAG: DUF2304 domain-containing protein [Clostridia bacterium]|nr:DUF2304 domain-containing protein [Clostridia bacterium]